MEWLVKILQMSADMITAMATVFYATVALLTFGAIVYVGVVQLRQMREDSHKQLIKNLVETWEADPMLQSREAFAHAIKPQGNKGEPRENEERLRLEAANLKVKLEELEAKNDPKLYSIMRIANYMESVGYLMKSRTDRKTIKDLMGNAVVYYFSRYKPWLEQYRHEKKWPRLYEYFEGLYHSCKE